MCLFKRGLKPTLTSTPVLNHHSEWCRMHKWWQDFSKPMFQLHRSRHSELYSWKIFICYSINWEWHFKVMKYLGICNNRYVAIQDYSYPVVQTLIDNNSLNTFFTFKSCISLVQDLLTVIRRHSICTISVIHFFFFIYATCNSLVKKLTLILLILNTNLNMRITTKIQGII